MLVADVARPLWLRKLDISAGPVAFWFAGEVGGNGPGFVVRRGQDFELRVDRRIGVEEGELLSIGLLQYVVWASVAVRQTSSRLINRSNCFMGIASVRRYCG